MRPFWKRQPAVRAEPSAPVPDEDLLARHEEEAFVASVRKKRQERETPLPAAPAAAPPEAEIEWSEQDDAYRPRRADASVLLLSLAVPTALDLRKGAVYCFARREAFDRIQDHLRSDTRIELGGLLVGEAFYDPERDLHCVVVEAALPAYAGEGTAVTFSYTEATWQALSPQLQGLPPAWTLLGSYHSHPGMGVFLSSTDLDTQRGVFFHDWQIALVIDPVSRAVGFFCGSEGRRCAHWELV